MSQITTTMADAISIQFNEIFMQTYGNTVMPYEKIFRTIQHDSLEYKISAYSGLSLFTKVNELENYPDDNIEEMWNKTYTVVKLAKTISFSKEAVSDVQKKYADVSSQITALANSRSGDVINAAQMAKETIDSYCAEILANADSSTATYSWGDTSAGPDSQALVSDSHPYNPNDSTSLDNKYTTALSHDALDSLMNQIDDNMKDPRGQIISILDPSIMVVPSELEPMAMRIRNSDKVPSSANNDDNIYQNRFEVLKWRKLTDANNWFLVVPPSQIRNGLFVIERQKPEINYSYKGENGSHNFYIDFRFVPGFYDWRAIWGSIVS